MYSEWSQPCYKIIRGCDSPRWTNQLTNQPTHSRPPHLMLRNLTLLDTAKGEVYSTNYVQLVIKGRDGFINALDLCIPNPANQPTSQLTDQPTDQPNNLT